MPDGLTRPRRRWPVLVSAAAIVAVVGVAWVLQGSVSDGGEPSKGGSPPLYSIKVEQGGVVLKEYDLAALRSLPQTAVMIDGKEQTGPLLTVLLRDAGADGYQTVDVHGAGIRDQGDRTLSSAQARQGAQLDFSDRGTVKLCGPRLDRTEWVRDVISINAD